MRWLPIPLALVFVVACTGSDPEPDLTATSSPTATATSSPTPSPTATPATRTPTATPTALPPLASTTATAHEAWPVRVSYSEESPVLGLLRAGQQVTVSGAYAPPEGEIWLALEGLGWAQYEPSAITLDAPLDRLAWPAVPPLGSLYDTTPDLGLPLVERVIAAVLSDDRATLAGLLQYQALECTAAREASDSPPGCPEGVEPGTPVEVFPVFCEESGWSFGPTDALVDSILVRSARESGGPFGLYAITAADDTYLVEVDYRIIFGNDEGASRVILVNDLGITGVSWGERPTPAPSRLRSVELADMVLPPIVPPDLNPAY